ncbi:hypothetical protein ACCC92_26590 [Mucilaginibacter sp. Mucisp84]|uniref:hypothetical protein n=1 Tax=Mucilaginibacter sp. Mucisp84 TaxID=3243058 RepID=UPI0039A5E99F
MKEIRLYGVMMEAHRLFHINKHLSDWDLSPVEGKGLYVRGNENYGHIEIKIYKSLEYDTKMIWNLNSDQLPDEWGAKEAVEHALRFFISYLEGIRGEDIPLIFEVIGGSYHPVESKARNYTTATIYAIVDCFAKNVIEFRSHRLIKKNIY